MAAISGSLQIQASSLNNAPTFFEKLEQTVQELGLSEANWDSKKWADVARLATNRTLEEIFQYEDEVADLFHLLSMEQERPSLSPDTIKKKIHLDPKLSKMPYEQAVASVLRTLPKYYNAYARERPKQLSRIQEKLTYSNIRRLNGYNPYYFQAISDCLAFVVPIDRISDIQSVAEHLENTALEQGGMVYIEGQTNAQWGYCIDNKYYWKDIMQALYVYLPKYGIIEFRIAHPIAQFTLARTLELAHCPDQNRDKVPLSFFDEFYQRAKSYLLNEANGMFHHRNSPLREHQQAALIEAAKALHRNQYGKEIYPMEDTLKNILNTILGKEEF